MIAKRSLSLFHTLAVTSALAGCAAGSGLSTGVPDYVPTDAVLQKMTSEQARRSVEAWARSGTFEHVRAVSVKRGSISVSRNDGTTQRLKLVSLTPNLYCAERYCRIGKEPVFLDTISQGSLAPGSAMLQWASGLANAFYVLKANAIRVSAEDERKARTAN